jgi:prepilin signal peptidase PulO-like enzyme (type II secretory pathway)
MHFHLDVIIGIIVSGIFGGYIGNFATNPIYRLPRNEPLFLKDPYCGDCNHRLVRKDLYPVVSWLLARGKCSYCGAAIPGGYALTEAFIGLLFIICYLEYGFSENFLLVSLGLTAYVMLSMMLYIDNFFSNMTLVACMVLGMMYRTLNDGTIYTAAGGGFAGLMIGAAVWRFSKAPLIRDIKAFPSYMKLLVASGIWLTLPQLLIVLIVAAVARGWNRYRFAVEQAIIVGTSLLVLSRIYSHFIFSL